MENKTLNRGQFLKTLGLSSKALIAFYCIGAVTACSKDEVMADGNTGGTTGGGTPNMGLSGTTTGDSLDFTLDLTSANYGKLKNVGEFVIVGDALVANANGNYIALSKTCTHQGTQLQYRKNEGDIWCNNHGSEFNLTGTVKKSPASMSLKVFKTTFDGTTQSLSVKA
jgi:cytochrome b6-f complex iron-sulfur subunit